jgi:hypothetical protein
MAADHLADRLSSSADLTIATEHLSPIQRVRVELQSHRKRHLGRTPKCLYSWNCLVAAEGFEPPTRGL